MLNIEIRIAEKKDIPTLVNFNKAMAYETEDKILDKKTLTKGVEKLFDSKDYGFYLIAENKDKILGSLMITTEWSDWRNGLFWWIQSLYVISESRRKGVYRRLYEFVKELASQKKEVCGFRLYVEKENSVAQEVYKKLKMRKTNYEVFEEV